MTKREFAIIAVRLLGIYIIGTSFSNLAGVAARGFRGALATIPWTQQILVSGAPFYLQVIFGIFLLLSATSLACWMVEGLSENDFISNWRPRELACCGLVFVGLLLLLNSVLLFGRALSVFMLRSGNPTTLSQNLMHFAFYVLLAALCCGASVHLRGAISFLLAGPTR